MHSVHTLAIEHSIHSKSLRKHLRAEGLISEADMAKSDHSVRLEAGKALELAKRLGATLSRVDAMEHLNAPMSQMRFLIKHGFVRPGRRTTGFGAWNRYPVADLDAFLERLGVKSPSAGVHRKRLCNIPQAARRCSCSGADVVRLILDRKLSTSTLSNARGYLSILVDPKAVAEAVRGPETNAHGLSLRRAARALGTNERVLQRLIAFEHIARVAAVNRFNRRPQALVRRDEIEAFKAKYVSLHTLAKERRVGITIMRKRLDEAGVRLAFDRKQVGARFYARDEVRKANLQ